MIGPSDGLALPARGGRGLLQVVVTPEELVADRDRGIPVTPRASASSVLPLSLSLTSGRSMPSLTSSGSSPASWAAARTLSSSASERLSTKDFRKAAAENSRMWPCLSANSAALSGASDQVSIGQVFGGANGGRPRSAARPETSAATGAASSSSSLRSNCPSRPSKKANAIGLHSAFGIKPSMRSAAR